MGLTYMAYIMALSFTCLYDYLILSCLSLNGCKFYKGQDRSVCSLHTLVFSMLSGLDKRCLEIFEWIGKTINKSLLSGS